jgi:hypothetical protein
MQCPAFYELQLGDWMELVNEAISLFLVNTICNLIRLVLLIQDANLIGSRHVICQSCF